MLIAKIYGVSWLALAALAGLLFVTDSITVAAAMVLGFIASVLAGAGMLVVYPVMMNEDLMAQRQQQQ